MRALALVALAACSSDSTEMSSCPTMTTSNIQNTPGAIISGESVIGMMWLRQIGRAAPEVHGSIVASDGVIGPDIALTDMSSTGAAGTTTVAWSTLGCFALHPFTVSLQRGGEVTRLEIANSVKSSDLAFDGQRYQLVWTTSFGSIEHRSLDEDGTLGPVHVLVAQVLEGVCAEVATDRAGTTFVHVNSTGYIVDTATGDKRQVLEAPFTRGQSFYFAGEFHVHDDVQVMSFPPTSTGAYTVHILDDFPFAQRFYATPARLFVLGNTGLLEADANFKRIGFHGAQQFTIGTFGDDLVTFARTELDPFARTPGRLELLRAAGETWRVEVAVDSPVIDEELCDKPE